MVHVNIDTLGTLRPFFPFSEVQHGSGFVDDKNYFTGLPFQRGYGSVRPQSGRGISNVLRLAWRFLAPVLTNIGKQVGTEALATGGRILSTLSSDRSDVKGTVKTQLKSGAKKIMRQAGEELIQRGSGRRRQNGRFLGDVITKKETRTKKKQRTKKDILGMY